MTDKTQKMLSRRDFLKASEIALSGVLLAACAQATETTAPEEAAPEEPTTAPAAGEVNLRYIHWWCEGDAHYNTINWQIEEFQKRNPGITIESVCIPSDAPAKITAECSAGKCPEIVNWASPQQAEAGPDGFDRLDE
jgi:ABC-type glycerol-3-phosphate transport system substrate-binding protein